MYTTHRWREQARKGLKLEDPGAFALLLVGNDLRKKGLDALLTAMGGDARR